MFDKETLEEIKTSKGAGAKILLEKLSQIWIVFKSLKKPLF
jgi:hypothetical protein